MQKAFDPRSNAPRRRVRAGCHRPRRDAPAQQGAAGSGGGEPRVIRCQATRKQPRFQGERCNGFVHRGMRDLKVHSLVQHSDEAPRELEVVGCIRCGALHVLEAAREPTSGTRGREPP